MKKIVWTTTLLVSTCVTAFTPAFVSQRAMTFTSPTNILLAIKDDAHRLSDEYSHLQDELLRNLAQSEQKHEQAQHVADVMLEKDVKGKNKYNKLQDELLSDLAESEQKKEQAKQVADVMFDTIAQDEYSKLQDELLHDLADSEVKKDQAQHVADVMFKEDAKAKDVYSHLQDELFSNLAESETTKRHAEEVSEVMFKKAIDMTALERYEQIDKLDKAERELQMAHEERNVAEAMHHQAHNDYVAAQEQASMLEESSIINDSNDEYHDQERLRDLSVAHAAHHLEDDIKNRIVDARFHELEAEAKVDEAKNVLKNLEEQEQELKATLNELQSLKQNKAMEQWNNLE
jgi:hypothetical protein